MRILQELKIVGLWDFIYHDLQGNEINRITKKNLITQTGLDFFASLLINEQTNDVPFYITLGNGTKVAEVSDDKLQNEMYRKIVTSKTRQSNMVRFRFFFSTNEANGDWQEYAVFAAGTENKDSGIMLNRLVSPVSKADNTVLTIEVKIIFQGG